VKRRGDLSNNISDRVGWRPSGGIAWADVNYGIGCPAYKNIEPFI
jgi:hypothetical protein